MLKSCRSCFACRAESAASGKRPQRMLVSRQKLTVSRVVDFTALRSSPKSARPQNRSSVGIPSQRLTTVCQAGENRVSHLPNCDFGILDQRLSSSRLAHVCCKRALLILATVRLESCDLIVSSCNVHGQRSDRVCLLYTWSN